MARLSRLAVPGYLHNVTLRGIVDKKYSSQREITRHTRRYWYIGAKSARLRLKSRIKRK